ncbi:MAG: T9SS type A sorting domain-containing protein [Bacteroidetes bacterium]|nr:T9SS type A sorting domain-containing protein [Bacteroidota bacterium]MBU1116444.1 T9SS type A sorting domain-containing protein [Bacteroidota bacterium]MBU1800023.1 T9SS type A sorting domain-containing protein [Bacteroidota bacterium]
MNKLYIFTLFLAMMVSLSAQSTTETVRISKSQALEISNIINADTSVSDYRIYELERGGIYYLERAFLLNSSCKFAAYGNDARPPVLAMAVRADGSAEGWFFYLSKSGTSLEVNDIYMLSMANDGTTLGWSRGISIHASNISVKLRRVVFDGFTEAGIRVQSDYVKLDVQDCHFRNFLHSGSYFGGQPFMTDVNKQDSTIFINNTFFACNSYLFSVRSLCPKAVFEHNSVIYTVVNPFLIRQSANLSIDNNLFYAVHAWGGDPEQVIGAWFLNYPDSTSSSIYRIRRKGVYNGYETTGPEYYNDEAAGEIFIPSERVHKAENNNNYNPVELVDFYKNWNDTVTVMDSVEVLTGPKQHLLRKLTMATWANDLSLNTLDTLAMPDVWDHTANAYLKGNLSEDPGFNADVKAHVNELVGYVNRIASRKLDNPWHYELNFPPKWPIPENLAYSNTTLQSAGTDGFALGDLNWFPSQKADWITGVEEVGTTVPSEYTLSQNYPNPFNPTTNIEFSIPEAGIVSLKVFDVLGQEVTTLLNREMTSGSYKVNFNASKLTSGIYFYTLNGKNYSNTKKMILVK